MTLLLCRISIACARLSVSANKRKKRASSEIAHERIAWQTASCEAETIDFFSLYVLLFQYILYDVIIL